MSVFIFAADINLDHYTFSCHLLYVSAVFDHHQVDITKTCMENNTETRGLPFTANTLKQINVLHSPTNALFIILVKSFKFTLKCTIISLVHVSVFNDHYQGALSVPNSSYIYVKTLGKITSLYKLGDVAACRRAACVLCAVQSEIQTALHTTHSIV